MPERPREPASTGSSGAPSPWPHRADTPGRPHRAALIVALAAAAAFVLSTLIGVVPSIGFTLTGTNDVGYLPFVLLQVVTDLLTQALPFALGVYLVLAFVRPVRDASSIRSVLGRAALAAAAGSVLLVVATVVYSLFQYGGFYGSVFGARFPEFSIAGGNIAFVLIDTVGSAALAFVRVAPVVALAGVLQWLWGSRAEHPPQ